MTILFILAMTDVVKYQRKLSQMQPLGLNKGACICDVVCQFKILVGQNNTRETFFGTTSVVLSINFTDLSSLD